MMARERPIRFQYDPEATLRETEQMRPLEELSFRRVLDLIVLSRNRLINDDTELARMTKAGPEWLAIKARLVNDHRALYVSEAGYVRNMRYDDLLASVERVRQLRREAGKTSAAKRAGKNAATPRPSRILESAIGPVPRPTPEPAGLTPVDPPRQQVSSTTPPATGVEAGAPTNAKPGPVLPATPVAASRPDAAAPEPDPMVNVDAAAPMIGDGNGDGRSGPEQEGTRIPLDWQPGPEGIAFAAGRGFAEPEISDLVRGYVSHRDARGDTSMDHNPGFKLWVLRDLAANPPPGARQPVTA